MQALWMVLGALLFATMGLCVKYASAWFTSAELVFYRGVIGIVFLWLLARSRGVSLGTRYPAMHAWRSLIGVVSLGAWFYAIAHLPLATAVTLNYMSSVWIAAFLVGGALLAWVPVPGRDGKIAKPPLQGTLILTVLAGFAGVVLMLKPSVGGSQGFAGLMGLLSGLTAAFAYMQVVALSRAGEPEARTVFYFAVGSAVAGGLVAAVEGFTPFSEWTFAHAIWLLPVGLLAAGGQLCMTRAYATAKSESGTLLVANLQYSGIVFAAFYGVVLFGDRIDLLGWTGMALIIGSGIAATFLRQRSLPKAPAEEH
ncbi:DMT family transporter [Variovorax arabinosiphilus]|jgi:drug/metabolite transporter (DMT)-like permease|uniref:DMT family transporter n=1 Tax=Variovorax arabinosiphilus TaxID=3053498 RepID=UPI002575AB86|nr:MULTISPECIES: DMT family transporter [unclassified Variovorax]MDM0122922.1 DMT family transporter [Variovorax sp. J2L1-78]MDM0132082.1 DMT family transporter [Variovorax sp. J2L1-63]MDM0235685.1 DMT family transporter [Variovorax sp. J2R1-6]